MKAHPLATLKHAFVSILLFSGSVSWAAPWGHHAINAEAAWQITRGEGVKVGILDTGIQKNHPDLQANIIGGINLVKGAGGANKWDDDNGHGTHIAGIIAALENNIGYIGVAPSAKLFVVKVLHKDYVTKPSLIDPKVVADGIYACMNNGVQVINMSFGISVDSPVLRDAIIAAYNIGIVLVASVGDNSSPNVLYPAKYPEVIAVSSIQSNGYNSFSFAWYSNWGQEVDFTAPGTGTYSTWIGSSYKGSFGTGQAAAHVSGVAALMLSAGKTDLVARDVTPDPLTPEQRGHGLIDAYLTVSDP
jgi:subtilisin family serine protease